MVPLNEITVVDFGDTFAKAIVMKISADQRYVSVEGPRKSPQDSDVNEGGMYRDAQAEQTHPPTAFSRPTLSPQEQPSGHAGISQLLPLRELAKNF